MTNGKIGLVAAAAAVAFVSVFGLAYTCAQFAIDRYHRWHEPPAINTVVDNSIAAPADSDPASTGCVVPPDSLEGAYEKFNAEHGKYRVVKDCYADGKMRLFAIERGSSVIGMTRKESGWARYNITIWKELFGEQRWQMTLAIAQADLMDSVVQVWTFDIVNGQPANMRLKSVDFYQRLRVTKGFEFAPDGTTVQRVYVLNADNKYDVAVYNADGNLEATGTVSLRGDELVSPQPHVGAAVHVEAVPAGWLALPDLTGVPMPSEAR